MKGLESIFAKAFEAEAERRGFVLLDRNPAPFAFPLYKTEEWVIGAMMKTMFPETTVTITFSPQNPPADSSRQHMIKCEAEWIPDSKKWLLPGGECTTEELISKAFDQMAVAAI
ncbi:MAG: hypothetical protein WCT03_04485 [Candidatus Obscuribacterales bacterium]|jgi:hypothetical protein